MKLKDCIIGIPVIENIKKMHSNLTKQDRSKQRPRLGHIIGFTIGKHGEDVITLPKVQWDTENIEAVSHKMIKVLK